MKLWAIRSNGRYQRYAEAGFGMAIKVFTTEVGAQRDADSGDEVAEVDDVILNALFVASAGTEDGFLGVYLDGKLMPWTEFECFVAASSRQ